MDSTLPKITIITPVFNRADFLERAIQSLIVQNYPNLEYIVMDAGSMDGTLDIIKKYQDFITIWKSEKDKGAYDAMNKGIALATGEIVGLLLSDDWFEPELLRYVADAYVKAGRPAVVTCGSRFVKERNGQLVELYRFDGSALDFTVATVLKYCLSHSRFIRRDIYQRYGEYEVLDQNEKYIYSADLFYYLNLALHGEKGASTNYIGYNCLEHEGSQTLGRKKETILRLYKERLEYCYAAAKSLTGSKREQALLMDDYRQCCFRLFCRVFLDKNHRKQEITYLWKNLKGNVFSIMLSSVQAVYRSCRFYFVKQFNLVFVKFLSKENGLEL